MSPSTVPQDIDAERNLLTTMCLPGAESAAAECCNYLREEDFIHPDHKFIFMAVCRLLESNTEISLTTINDALSKMKLSNRIGGFSGVSEILSGIEVSKPMVLVDILRKHRQKRELIKIGYNIYSKAQDDSFTPEEITSEAGSSLSHLCMTKDRKGIRHISEVGDEAMADIEQEFDGSVVKANWIKGWTKLNRILGGFRPGQLIILAARPAVGKTALALNWALGLTEYGKSAGIFSLEMQADRLWRRLAASKAGVDLKKAIYEQDRNVLQKIRDAKVALDERGIWIEDKSGITPREIQGETDALISRQPNLGMLIVDHLGLITSPQGSQASKSEATRIGDITRSFKILASDRKVPVLVLSQLNREVEKRSGGRPQLSDLRDSGCVEQDADVVMFIHRDTNQEVPSNTAKLIIAKNREGEIGTIDLLFHPGQTRYEEVENSTVPFITRPIDRSLIDEP